MRRWCTDATVRFGVCLLVLAAAAAGGPTANEVEAEAAKRIADLGVRACGAGQEATARRMFERALELDPDQPLARKRLGYRRVGRKWKAPRACPLGEDVGTTENARYLAELRNEERRLAGALVEAGIEEKYAEILKRFPRHEGVHKALGHTRIGSRYVRPELVETVRRYDGQRERWRELAAPADIKATKAAVPAFGERPAHRSEGPPVSGTLPEDEIRSIARTLHAPHAFLRELFGDIETWNRDVIIFVHPKQYRTCVMALFPPGEDRDFCLRHSMAESTEVAVFASSGAEKGRDAYAHTVANFSMGRAAAPRREEGLDEEAYAWFSEGMGYFASLALHKTGSTWFCAVESSTKIPPTVPPPEHNRYRSDLLSWLQGQMRDGTTEPLRGVCGRRLNSLDLLMSLEAWSFLEFLAACDPEAFRGLPRALRAQVKGSYADRSEAALLATFGKGFDALEPLWRVFVLEVM